MSAKKRAIKTLIRKLQARNHADAKRRALALAAAEKAEKKRGGGRAT